MAISLDVFVGSLEYGSEQQSKIRAGGLTDSLGFLGAGGAHYNICLCLRHLCE